MLLRTPGNMIVHSVLVQLEAVINIQHLLQTQNEKYEIQYVAGGLSYSTATNLQIHQAISS